MKLLIVDDSKTMRLIVMRALRMAGFGDHDTLEAANGKEALDIIHQEKPHLVISDWNMPEMSGLDLLKALREEGNSVNFGFVTTEATAKMRGVASEAGAQFLIAKPFTAETLEDTLQPLLAV